jgi:hypothetical protein
MKFILANQTHDAQLRAMVRSAAMPGHIQIAYEREPDFFQGLGIQGTFNQVVAAEENGQLAGFGCRSIRPLFINGEEIDFGYLSALRSSPQAKQRLGIARGYRTFKELHGDGRCSGYTTTIIEGNAAAFATIASGRAGLPAYQDMGRCLTYAIALNRHGKPKRNTEINVRFAHASESALVIDLLRRFGSAFQFFPALHESDFDTPLLRDLPATRFLIAEDATGPCGVAALWNQSAFKQHRIRAYSRSLRILGPVLNAGLRLGGFHPLPKIGRPLHHAYLSFKAARNNDPGILRALVDHARLAAGSKHSHLIVGFHGDDPARKSLARLPVTVYRSRLFFAGWEAEMETFHQLDGRIPYFEPAIL